MYFAKHEKPIVISKAITNRCFSVSVLRMHVYKSCVKTMTDGITNKGQFPGNRVAKVSACALSLTSQALRCLRGIKSGELSEEKQKEYETLLRDNLILLRKGLRHELTIVNVVHEDGFQRVKSFESHERMDSAARKRLAHVRTVAKAEEKQKKAPPQKKHDNSKPFQKNFQKNNSQNQGQNQGGGGKNNKLVCFLCQQFGHVSKDCKSAQRPQGGN